MPLLSKTPWRQYAIRRRTWWQWVEALLVPVIGLALALLVHPDDAFTRHDGFPWLWLAPLLVALRYGVLPGLLSGGVLLAAWPVWGDAPIPPAAYFIGGLMLVIIGGQFSGLWHTRERRVQELNQYLDQRMDQLARRYHLLRLSHERLEQNLISRPQTLRDSLAKLRDLLATLPPHEGLSAAQPFLDFMTEFCQLEGAVIFAAQKNRLLPDPVALVGRDMDYQVDDPLIRFALDRRELCHVQSENIDIAPSKLLVALPLKNSLGQLMGLLAVKQMPFFALTDDNLQMLSVLSAYYTEQIVVRDSAAALLDVMPDCPREFAYEVFNLQRVQRETGISSVIVVQIFHPGRHQRDAFELVRKHQRALDQVWAIDTTRNRLLVTLMPLATLVSLEGYLARIEHLLREQLALTLAEAGYETRHVELSQPAGWLLLQDVLNANRN
ncbi:PelD GGDEF domain-containing protein [Silvimonas sp. JCM 19000]